MSKGLLCDEDLIRRLPLPLAKLYRRAHNAKTPLDRHQAAYYLWEASLKLLGSVAIIAYAERARTNQSWPIRCKTWPGRPSGTGGSSCGSWFRSWLITREMRGFAQFVTWYSAAPHRHASGGCPGHRSPRGSGRDSQLAGLGPPFCPVRPDGVLS